MPRARLSHLAIVTVASALAFAPRPSYADDESMAALPADPLLAELIRQSLAARPELRAADLEARADRERIAQVSAFPDLTLSLGIQNDGFTDIEIGTMDTSFVSIGVSQTFPWPGKRAARGDVAGLAADGAQRGLVRARLGAEADVRRAYLDLLLSRGRLALLDELEGLWQRSQELARSRYEVGAGPQSDILRAQLERSRLRQRRYELVAEERARVQALNRLRGRPLDEPLATTTKLSDIADPLEFPAAEDVASAEAGSPELAQARLAIRRADRSIDLARKNQYPDFTVMGAVMVRGSLPPMWQLGLAVNLPLLWGRAPRTSAISESELRATAERSSSETVVQILHQRVAERRSALEALLETVHLYRDGLLVQSSATVESTLAQYRVGKVTFASVLEAVAGYIGDQESYLQQLAALQRIAVARAEISLEPIGLTAGAMGGGSVPGAGGMGAAGGARPSSPAAATDSGGGAPAAGGM